MNIKQIDFIYKKYIDEWKSLTEDEMCKWGIEEFRYEEKVTSILPMDQDEFEFNFKRDNEFRKRWST